MSLSGGCNTTSALLLGRLGDTHAAAHQHHATHAALRGGASSHHHHHHHVVPAGVIGGSLRRVPGVHCLTGGAAGGQSSSAAAASSTSSDATGGSTSTSLLAAVAAAAHQQGDLAHPGGSGLAAAGSVKLAGGAGSRRGGRHSAARQYGHAPASGHCSLLPPPPPSAGVFSHGGPLGLGGLGYGYGHGSPSSSSSSSAFATASYSSSAHHHHGPSALHGGRPSRVVPLGAAPGDKAGQVSASAAVEEEEEAAGDQSEEEEESASGGRAWRSRTGRARTGRRWIPRGEQIKRSLAAEAEDSSLAAAERWAIQQAVDAGESLDEGLDGGQGFANNVLPLISSSNAVELEPTPRTSVDVLPDSGRRRPPTADDGKVKPEGTGREILLQGFNWESHRTDWYAEVGAKAAELRAAGFSLIWLPPASQSVSDEGYMPVDYYNLNSKYGSEDGLRECVRSLHAAGLGVLADIVVNHRCAEKQDQDGVWNVFGGRMAWDQSAIVGDDPNYRGRGHPATGTLFHAAPNIDHRQQFVRDDIKAWMAWLKDDIGFDGWRFDFTKGYGGEFVGEYVEATSPLFAVGEYWDTLSYSGNYLDYNQNNHRQRTVDWINATGGRSLAFDMTTKGILHSVIQNREYWRLSDEDGKPPGVLGWWPSKTCTFIENHDTGSTQGHWRFPDHGVEQGYAYILTHPGTPTVFWDHYFAPHWQAPIQELMRVRLSQRINCRSQVHILKADSGVYAAQIDDRVVVKIGPGDWSPNSPGQKTWEREASGHQWCVWVLEKVSREAMDVVMTSSFIEAPPKGDADGNGAPRSDEEAIKRLFEPPQIMHDD